MHVLRKNSFIRRGSHLYIVVILMLLLAAMLLAAKPTVKVVASGEAHGMIDACDCELSPGGGVAKRATLLKQLRKSGPFILVDAGGFSAGGIYDDYTEGRVADSVRTLKMLAAMGLMRYDAVAVGDDDLQYGGKWLARHAAAFNVPLVSANCFTPDGQTIAAPYIIVRRGGKRIGITAVCTRECLFPLDTTVRITSPVPALRKIWKKLLKKTDLQIILSHTGSDISRKIAHAFPECDLVVNGHRKTDAAPGAVLGSTAILDFSFQVKSLSSIELVTGKNSTGFSEPKWHDVTPDITNDDTVQRVLSTQDAVETRNTYDLYIMSQCPYGLEALREFIDFSTQIPDVDWNVWFIGTMNSDTVFSSLHGKEEVNDELLWLAIKDLYPDIWTQFCRTRSSSQKETWTIAERLGAHREKVDAWIGTFGKAKLSRHYFRSMRLSINASPTLLVNNRPFSRKILSANLLRFECGRSAAAVLRICKELPECSEEIDCRKKGFHGRCTQEGTCVYEKAVSCSLIVVIADSTRQHPEYDARETTENLFPGADIKTVSASSKQGRKILQQFSPEALPFYLFDSAVIKASNFPQIKDGLVTIGRYLTFNKGVVPVNYLRNRKKLPGALTLIGDPFFGGIGNVLTKILTDSLYRQRITVLPRMYADPGTLASGTEEFFRQEEALRWLALGRVNTTAVKKYLSNYRGNPGSSWWPRYLSGSTVSSDSLLKLAETHRSLLNKNWEKLNKYLGNEPVVLLKDNVELISVGAKREFEQLLREFIYTAP